MFSFPFIACRISCLSISFRLNEYGACHLSFLSPALLKKFLLCLFTFSGSPPMCNFSMFQLWQSKQILYYPGRSICRVLLTSVSRITPSLQAAVPSFLFLLGPLNISYCSPPRRVQCTSWVDLLPLISFYLSLSPSPRRCHHIQHLHFPPSILCTFATLSTATSILSRSCTQHITYLCHFFTTLVGPACNQHAFNCDPAVRHTHP